MEQQWTESGRVCRKVLLQTLASCSTTSAAEAISDLTVVLAEVLASRTIMINLLHTLGRGNGLPAEEVRALIERADTDKLRRALDRLQQLRKGSKDQVSKPDK